MGREKLCVRLVPLSFWLTSDFNYWPVREALWCSRTHTQTPQCTHTNIGEWYQDKLSQLLSCQLGGQWGVSWIIDELERGSRQIYSTRLTPCLLDSPFSVWQCDCVWGTEQEAVSLRSKILQLQWGKMAGAKVEEWKRRQKNISLHNKWKGTVLFRLTQNILSMVRGNLGLPRVIQQKFYLSKSSIIWKPSFFIERNISSYTVKMQMRSHSHTNIYILSFFSIYVYIFFIKQVQQSDM